MVTLQQVAFLEVDLEYPKKLCKLHNDIFAPDEVEIKNELSSKYWLMSSDFYNISINNDKKCLSFFDKENYVLRL